MKPRVYLAGPISGCNEEQRHAWRNDLKLGFGDEFDFIDPMDNLVGKDRSDFEVVEADIAAILTSDVVLANMWRESIGTSFGILHAHGAAKIVVVCDPNFLGNRMLAFYADAVERTLPAALNAARTFLSIKSRILEVVKSDGAEEPFDRQKLAKSVRKACLDSGQSDLGPSRAIVSKALEGLLERADAEHRVTAAQVREAVWEALAELASDPVHEANYHSIRQAWERFDAVQRPPEAGAQPTESPVLIHDKPLQVAIRSLGTHSTIWGKGKFGAEAMAIFQEIMRVDGITEIRFGPFKNTSAPPAKPHIRLSASTTPYIIEGKCYDHGEKGTLQTFQVRVADPSARDRILKTLQDHLVSKGHIRAILQ